MGGKLAASVQSRDTQAFPGFVCAHLVPTIGTTRWIVHTLILTLMYGTQFPSSY